MLISKGKRDVELPRSLLTLETAEKVLKKVIYDSPPKLYIPPPSYRQIQFGSAKSSCQVQPGVKHAIKSVRWANTLDTLDNYFHLPGYFLQILRDHLRDHCLFYEMLELESRVEMTWRVAQRSMLRSNLPSAFLLRNTNSSTFATEMFSRNERQHTLNEWQLS